MCYTQKTWKETFASILKKTKPFTLLAVYLLFNSFQKHKTLDSSYLQAFADDKTCVTWKLEFVLGNIVGKGESAGYLNFLLLPECFQKFFFPCRVIKSQDCVL